MTTPFPFVAGAVLTAAELNAITTLPINDQTDDYTLVVGDVGKRVIMNKGTANTVTVDDSIFAAGDTIFIANKGAGTSTITAGAGVTINSASGLDLVTSQSGQLVALSASSFLFVASDVIATSGVVQVKSTAKTDTFTTASATFTGVTGLTVAITPTNASNKVLVIAQISYAMASGAGYGHFKLSGGNTSAYVGDSPGSRIAAVFGGFSSANEQESVLSASIVFLDSPATTSATTYGIDVRTASSGSVFINRAAADSDDSSKTRGASSITVFEVTP